MLMVRDVDALLDEIDPEAFSRDERLPYWAQLWPAALALGGDLLARPPEPGSRVLELGCGLALPTVVAAKLGCTVLATDYEEIALKFARYNSLRNGVSERVGFGVVDWRTSCLSERFQYVIGSDIWFDRADIPPLLRLTDGALEAGGVLIASDPGRWGVGRAFFQELEGRGYRQEEYRVALDLDGDRFSVGVYRLRKG